MTPKTIPEFIDFLNQEIKTHRPETTEQERKEMIAATLTIVRTQAGIEAFMKSYISPNKLIQP